MSLGKSAWQASSNKVTKVGGVSHPKAKYDKNFAAPTCKQLVQPLIRIATNQAIYTATSIPANTPNIQANIPIIRANTANIPANTHKKQLVSKKQASTARDHLNLWGDVETKNPESPIEYFSIHESRFTDFELLPDNNPLTMTTDDIDEVWRSDQEMMMMIVDEDDLHILGDDDVTADDDGMMMVDPRDIEGGCSNIEEIEIPNDDSSPALSLPDGFDLLEFVMDSTIGPDDPVFRSHIDNESLFLQDDDHDIPVDLLSTIDCDQINFLTSESVPADQGPTSNEPALPAVVPKEEELELPAKRPRGRPRVPRTSSLKALPRYKRVFFVLNISFHFSQFEFPFLPLCYTVGAA
jgi:hypothetical protein